MTCCFRYACIVYCTLISCLATGVSPSPVELVDARNSESSSDRIVLESFDPPTHEWSVLNDPVMGGRSSGSFVVNDHGIGSFTGTVRNVPFLHVPGFIQARSIASEPYPDISSCTAFELLVRTTQPEYAGYRFSFGTRHAPDGKRFAYGYKVHFTIPDEGYPSFQTIQLPFDSFTDAWDDATGDPIHTCNITDVHDSVYCPDEAALRNIQTMSVWGEGVLGEVSIEIYSIAAVNCNASNHRGNSDVKSDNLYAATTFQYSPPPLRSSTVHTEEEKHGFISYLDWSRHWSWLRRHLLRVWSQQMSLASMIVVPFLR